MHTNNMERRLNETEFLEKVKNKREAATTKIWKRDATPFFPGRGRFANICQQGDLSSYKAMTKKSLAQ